VDQIVSVVINVQEGVTRNAFNTTAVLLAQSEYLTTLSLLPTTQSWLINGELERVHRQTPHSVVTTSNADATPNYVIYVRYTSFSRNRAATWSLLAPRPLSRNTVIILVHCHCVQPSTVPCPELRQYIALLYDTSAAHHYITYTEFFKVFSSVKVSYANFVCISDT
jgi:hypothetical protein